MTKTALNSIRSYYFLDQVADRTTEELSHYRLSDFRVLWQRAHTRAFKRHWPDANDAAVKEYAARSF